MGTRSGIGIENNDGTVDSIHCHWDGYPSHHAPTLLKHYNSEEKVRELVKYGDMSSLRTNISPELGTHHSYDMPQRNVCIYYHRDRGENWEDVKPVKFENIENWYKASPERGQYDLYLFKNNKWFYTRAIENSCKLQELTEDFTDEE